MLSAIGAWFATQGLSAILGWVAGMASDYIRQRQADANAKAVGQLTVTAAVNKETADAERRAAGAAINAPDLGGVLDDMERGKF
jgi:hypothetical protein